MSDHIDYNTPPQPIGAFFMIGALIVCAGIVGLALLYVGLGITVMVR